MSESDPGCVKTPTLNLRVEFPSRFRRCEKSIALATSVRRRQLRKQFCASLAQASFHTAWTHSGKRTPRADIRSVGPKMHSPANDAALIVRMGVVRCETGY